LLVSAPWISRERIPGILALWRPCKKKVTSSLMLEHQTIIRYHDINSMEQSFLRNQQYLSYQEICNFYRAWGSLLSLQGSAPGLYPESNEISQIQMPSFLQNILIPSHLFLGLTSEFFPPDVLTRTLYAFYVSPICVTCHTHFVLLNFVIPVILDENHKLWTSTFCKCSPSSSYFVPYIQIVFAALCSQTLCWIWDSYDHDHEGHDLPSCNAT
jgi:hypothetical protein